MFGLDLDAWNVVMVSFLGVAAIAAVVVGISTAIIIKLQKQSELESSERIASLAVQGDQLRKDTAEANARALEARVELEKFKTPRTLTREQQERISLKIAPFAKLPFDMMVNPNPESQGLMMMLGTALRAAGWTWEGRSSGGLAISGSNNPGAAVNTSYVGLAVEIDVSRQRDWGPIVLLLKAAIEAEGIPITANIANDGSASPAAIHFLVGVKP